jgi:MFS family permease
MFATSVARISFSPLVPAITEIYGVSNGLIGLTLTGMWLTYGVVQFPSGVLATKYGERTTILFALGGTMAACLLVSVAPVFAVFVLGTVLLGTAAGMHYSVATTLLSRTYDNVGSAIGVHHLGGAAGGLLGPIAATWLLGQYSWHHAIVASAGVAGVAFVLFYWRVQPSKPQEATATDGGMEVGREAFEALRSFESVFLVAVMVVYMFVAQAVISFLPTFLVTFHGQSAALAGTIFAVFFVINGVMQTGIGVLADFLDRNLLIVGCLLLGVVGFGLLIGSGGLTVIATASVLVGVGTCGMTVLIAQIMEYLPDVVRSSGFGLTQSIVMVGGSFGSVSAGVVADTFGWGISFSVLGGLLALLLFSYGCKTAWDVVGTHTGSCKKLK